MNQREHKGLSIIEFPSEYICIDTETTGLDFEYSNIIEISALRVKDGTVIDTFSSLIKPPVLEGYDEDTDTFYEEYVSSFITKLTGITNEMLKTAPNPDDVLPKFFGFVGDSILVGHNVNFDINFVYDACQKVGLTLRNNFVDTMRIARKLLPELPHHRLSDIVSHFSIPQNNAHRAESDAMATMSCYEAMKELILSTRSLDDFKNEFKKKQTGHYLDSLKDIAPTVDEIDDTNPIYGKIVVFTGALSEMTRKQAFQIVVNLGGVPENRITQKTNFLVVGSQEFAQSVKDGKTSKMKKADEYRLKGQDISVLSENTFIQMIN